MGGGGFFSNPFEAEALLPGYAQRCTCFGQQPRHGLGLYRCGSEAPSASRSDQPRCRGGSGRLAPRFYAETSAKLFGVCLRILGERSEAEDVLQEVYLRVWRKAESFEESVASPITWLVAIARNRSIDRLRAGGTFRASLPIEAAAESPRSWLERGGAARDRRGSGEARDTCTSSRSASRRRSVQRSSTD